uniref:Uncharacterized protein n=1 Tax=viral metagenome TaxID=1070528 RepID=A0A6C0ACT6_9ZZZZ
MMCISIIHAFHKIRNCYIKHVYFNQLLIKIMNKTQIDYDEIIFTKNNSIAIFNEISSFGYFLQHYKSKIATYRQHSSDLMEKLNMVVDLNVNVLGSYIAYSTVVIKDMHNNIIYDSNKSQHYTNQFGELDISLPRFSSYIKIEAISGHSTFTNKDNAKLSGIVKINYSDTYKVINLSMLTSLLTELVEDNNITEEENIIQVENTLKNKLNVERLDDNYITSWENNNVLQQATKVKLIVNSISNLESIDTKNASNKIANFLLTTELDDLNFVDTFVDFATTNTKKEDLKKVLNVATDYIDLELSNVTNQIEIFKKASSLEKVVDDYVVEINNNTTNETNIESNLENKIKEKEEDIVIEFKLDYPSFIS